MLIYQREVIRIYDRKLAFAVAYLLEIRRPYIKSDDIGTHWVFHNNTRTREAIDYIKAFKPQQ